ncbi:MAG: TatD family hydrolase [Bacteroidaceae bacterium]|nr:TatD family hydrolase [Bacteroidaceae bacterium]
MIDTHAHLDGEEFAEDISEVIQRAKDVGVEKIFLPNVNEDTLQPIIRLCAAYPGYLYPMIGLHPEEVTPTKIDVDATLDAMESMLENHDLMNSCVAIGEVGLDLYWDQTYKEKQIEVFERQITWAIKYHLPLMIHARNAHAELVEIISKYQQHNLTGVFHCFTGTEEEATQLLSFSGFALGIGGVLTFKKSKLPEVLKSAVPLSRIVLETDSPYMAPVPHRGKRNESAFVRLVAEKLADIYNVTLQEVEYQTNLTVARIFPQANV